MSGRLSNFISVLRRHPFRFLVVIALLGAAGYLIWWITPGARFRRELTQAENALIAYDFFEARRHLARCLELRPDDSTARLLAAQAARRDGDLDAAVDQLVAYRELVGESTDREQLEWSMLDAQRGNVDRVVKYLIECLEIRHPASERILEALAIGSIQNYQYDRARFWVEETLERFPKNPVARLLRAQTSETFGNRELALDGLEELVRDFPRYANARLELANVLFAALRYDEAASHYTHVDRQHPGQLLPLLGIARCRERQDRADEAKSILGALRERNPDNSEVLLMSGRLANRDRQFMDAEAFLRRAVELAPFDHEIHQQLGICSEQLGQRDEAVAHVDRAKQIEADLARLEKIVPIAVKNPTDARPRLEAAQICLRNGQYGEGLRWLNGVLERDPNNREAHGILADYYASRDQQRAEYHRSRARQK
jgi:tetratricopeptide (TPR) repeat protein